VFIIVDLDRPKHGLIQVDQGRLLALQLGVEKSLEPLKYSPKKGPQMRP
jgi:hypothetical protein